MKVKTAELKGAALDWAVAHATKAWEFAHKWYPTMTLDPTFIGVRDYAIDGMIYLIPRNAFRQDPHPFNPSRRWEHGGPLIETYENWGVSIMRRKVSARDEGYCFAQVGPEEPENRTLQIGETALIAACRAIVMDKFGSSVEIPDTLREVPTNEG